MAARGRGRNHIASKTSQRYFRTDTDRGRGVLLSFHRTLPGGGWGGRGAQDPGEDCPCPTPASSLACPHWHGLGKGKGLIELEDGRRFERQGPDSCVCCGIFKRINAGSNHPAMLDLFLAQAGHCSISAAAGPRGCQFKCKWVIAAAPAKFAQPPGRGTAGRERSGARAQQRGAGLGSPRLNPPQLREPGKVAHSVWWFVRGSSPPPFPLPPALPGSPKCRDISSFLLPPAAGCPNATAQTRQRWAPRTLTAPFLRAGAADAGFGLFSSPHRYLCKCLNTANCRNI